MKRNVLIIGAGGVASVAAHKCAQNSDSLGDISIASRTVSKCDSIIKDIHARKNLRGNGVKLSTRAIDATNKQDVVDLIRETGSEIVLNLGSNFLNMTVMDACLEAKAAYLDTSAHSEPEQISYSYPWYDCFEWKRKPLFEERRLTAILSVGFDPGVVNAYAAHGLKHELDTIDEIDILDVNAGDHGRFFATNFDPEVNFREIVDDVGYWEDRQWHKCPPFFRSMEYAFPVVGKHKLYLMGHDELHSMSVNMDVRSIRFWMGFSDHYLNVFNTLRNIGLLNHEEVTTAEGIRVAPLKVVKACLPDPTSLAPGYTGKTCIGNLMRGKKNGKSKKYFIYNLCDHQQCYAEVGSQAISYTAGVPAVAAAMLVADGTWDVGGMKNVEELDPDPFLELLGRLGLPTEIQTSTDPSPG